LLWFERSPKLLENISSWGKKPNQTSETFGLIDQTLEWWCFVPQMNLLHPHHHMTDEHLNNPDAFWKRVLWSDCVEMELFGFLFGEYNKKNEGGSAMFGALRGTCFSNGIMILSANVIIDDLRTTPGRPQDDPRMTSGRPKPCESSSDVMAEESQRTKSLFAGRMKENPPNCN